MSEGVDRSSRRELARKAWRRGVLTFLVVAALLFGAAGTFFYWQAWVYLGLVFVPGALVTARLIAQNPELLERRLRTKERDPAQQWIVALAMVFSLAMFVIPGLDRRLGWSRVPANLVLL